MPKPRLVEGTMGPNKLFLTVLNKERAKIGCATSKINQTFIRAAKFQKIQFKTNKVAAK